MLPDKMEHCIVFMNSWDVSGVFWSFSKCNITTPHLPPTPLMWCVACASSSTLQFTSTLRVFCFVAVISDI